MQIEALGHCAHALQAQVDLLRMDALAVGEPILKGKRWSCWHTGRDCPPSRGLGHDGCMKNPVLYGLSNCDTVRKARAWLSGRGVSYEFHDFKKSGVPQDALARWLKALGHKELVNRKGTTWRQLAPAAQSAVTGDTQAQALLLAHPSAIRRPVVEWPNGDITTGFDPTDWAQRSKILPTA